MSDYYKILEIVRSATAKEIKKAYRKLAVKWHPDKNKSTEAKQKFQEIGEAYSVLSDADKKQKYDRFGKAGLDPNARAGFNPSDIFSSFFGNNTSFSGNHHPFANMGSPFGGFNGTRTTSIRQKGPNSKASVKISFKEMYLGCQKKFIINRKVKCDTCDAKGIKKGCRAVNCDVCGGRGSVIKVVRMGPMISQSHASCHKCAGNGTIIPPNAKCVQCGANKYIAKKTNVTLNIRKGINNNEIIKLRNLGDENEHWLEPGDIEFTVIVEPSKNNIRRANNDLIITKKILLSEALTGLEIVYTHLDDTNIIISTDEIIKPGKSYRINNLGFKNDGNIGDLIINFDIIFPDTLDEKRTEIINKILPLRKKKNNNGLKQYTIIPLEDNYDEMLFDEEQKFNENFECNQQ